MPETNYFKSAFAISNALCLGIVVSFHPFTSSALLFDCLQVWNVFCVPISKLVFQGVVESIQAVFIILILFSVFPSIPKFRSRMKSLKILCTPKIMSTHFLMIKSLRVTEVFEDLCKIRYRAAKTPQLS